jgi:restriction system protein
VKLQLHEKSLFAVLLRSQWWISIAIAVALTLAARMFLPDLYAIATGLPFLVIGAIAGWRQLRAPSAKRIAGTVEAVRAMSWSEFARTLEGAFERDGYKVARLDGAAADFELTKGWRVSLVSAKRWKAARTGVEPLEELEATRRKREAHECIYVLAGEITDNARAFATQKNIRLAQGAELVRLVRLGTRG